MLISVVLYRLRTLALFDAITTERMDKICKYYETIRILVFIIKLLILVLAIVRNERYGLNPIPA